MLLLNIIFCLCSSNYCFKNLISWSFCHFSLSFIMVYFREVSYRGEILRWRRGGKRLMTFWSEVTPMRVGSSEPDTARLFNLLKSEEFTFWVKFILFDMNTVGVCYSLIWMLLPAYAVLYISIKCIVECIASDPIFDSSFDGGGGSCTLIP